MFHWAVKWGGSRAYNIRTTVISPGAVATELPDSATEADVIASLYKFYEALAVPADSFARTIALSGVPTPSP